MPLKGADVVVEAVRELAVRIGAERVRLHLAGAEPDAAFAARLRELAEGLDVVFHGAFDAPELGEHPATAVHAMVSGTRAHESWGLVLDEALQLGLPAVLPRSGAFVERAGDWALTYEPCDPASLAAALGRLEGEAGLLARLRGAIPDGGRGGAFGTDEHVERTLAVYARALTAGAPEAPLADWWADGMRERELAAWDEAFGQQSAAALGFEERP